MANSPKFNFEKEEILNLLTGERFYGDNGAAVREAILNALDACHRQAARDGEDYTPDIQVEFDISDRRFIVHDNGDGMGEKEISELFTQVGKSARDLDTRGSENQVGEFGIGVVSYFLVSDDFDVYSKRPSESPVGYQFSKEMFAPGESANEASGDDLTERGTKIVLRLNESVSMKELKQAYKNWIRVAEPVQAREQPEGTVVKQQGLPELRERIDIDDLPTWVERADIGLGLGSATDRRSTGAAEIDLLYRGVYLDDQTIPDLWGLKGAIHVAPSEIEPTLNREDYLGSGRDSKLKSFLEQYHPKVLREFGAFAKERVQPEVRPSEQKEILTRWMSVPRSSAYNEAQREWDSTLRDVPIIEEITPSGRDPISVAELESLDRESIYYVENYRNKSDTLSTEAVSVLRKTDEFVFTGVNTRQTALRNTTPEYQNTGNFIIEEFSDVIPQICSVADHKREIIESDNSLINIFPGRPTIKTVSLGESSEPFVTPTDEIWLNVDCKEGEKILQYLLETESRERGLVIGCHLYSQNDIQEISAKIGNLDSEAEREIGPVRKAKLRQVIS